jgi:uncharacterized protein
MDAMCTLLQVGLPPSNLMATYARGDAARARNDPCTCGHGRKWKKCHGAASGQATGAATAQHAGGVST